MKTISNPISVLFVLILSLALLPVVVSGEGREDNRRVDRSGSLDLRIDRGLNRAEAGKARFRPEEVIVKYIGAERPARVSTRGRSVLEVVAELSKRADVEYAEPNYVAYAFFTPNDPFYSPYQWHFDNPTIGGVQAEAAWDVTTGSGVVVAVIDTGVAYEDYGSGRFNRFYQAPDLAGTSFVAGYDFVNNDTHPNDDEGHGTHVAGTIAGTTNNNEGVAGLAFESSIMPIKVLDSRGSGSYADVADGIRFAADNGADVINLSLGGPSPANNLEDAVCYAKSKGVTVVAAAGNDGNGSVSYPAAYNDCVIAVGATRFDETRAGYSNYGTALDLVAPGGDTSVDQNGDGYVDGVLQQTFGNNPSDFGYYFYQGTSMAAPHVAAAAALVIASGRATSPEDVQTLLEATADDLGAPGRDNVYGHGLINLEAATNGGSTSPPNPDPEPTPNSEPVADAGPDQTLADTDNNGFELVTLDGSGSYDSDGSIVSYQWHKGSTLLATSSNPTISLNVGTHTLILTVTDNEGASSNDAVLVTINEAPTPPPPTSVVFSDGFEDGIDAWTQDSQSDWKSSSRNEYEGRRSVEVDGRATNAELVSPNFNLGSASNLLINFTWFIERGLDAGEYLAFDVSTDGGTTWIEHRRLRGNVDPENVWISESVNISGASQVQLRFRGTMSASSEDAYVDAVVVEGV